MTLLAQLQLHNVGARWIVFACSNANREAQAANINESERRAPAERFENDDTAERFAYSTKYTEYCNVYGFNP